MHIYKSKGTEKSYRNLFHCFGVDDNLLHISLYGNNDTYTLEDNYRNTVVRKTYIDCNHPDRFNGTVFQYGDDDNLEKANELVLNAGDNFHVYRGLRHQMIALEDSELFEFSTQHFDSDSYRIIKGD